MSEKRNFDRMPMLSGRSFELRDADDGESR
jgi:hypothetical protein